MMRPQFSAYSRNWSLREAGLLAVEAQGRHRYFRLADEDVARLLESLMNVAFRAGALRLRSSPREPALRHARVCYDHLAGTTGVALYEQLLRRGALSADPGAVRLTAAGRLLMQDLGIDLEALERKRRPLCRSCLDWSERRHHLSGALGTALLARFQALGWAMRAPDSRVLTFTADGAQRLRDWSAG
jgi:hypothetical protein